ncbi:LTA synthase family protein [Streptococcus suis]|uniref:Lipoteichoic acid synthase 2 n=1 Tax=Streptococcus suis TaxID=1307 RepID=A0A0Z8M770_STRSU|nr:sulfatase-like hydrolase/transferase [Streptococcus suis]CYW03633.1 Lipoteichoic acid synthase 2 [Streptococcus suis]HEM4070517.1 sulfatase-like hydrolase/transferase [Streptococcus suis]HEM5070352.1 sulfatase-like hydrolase/transferase [Streptococcus suis]
MITTYKRLIKEYALYVLLSKYLFAVLLSIMGFKNHKDWTYILVTMLEVTSIATFSNLLLKEKKLTAYIANSLLLLIVNVQNIVLFFGGSFTTLVMVTNLESLESLSGHFASIVFGTICILIFTFLPITYVKIRKINWSTVLSSSLLIELIVTLMGGNIYSPIFGVYQLAADAYEYQQDLAKIANAPNVTDYFYRNTIQNARPKPDSLSATPNVVLIFVEGLSQNIVEDEREIMPNLKKFQESSLTFENYYNHTFATYRGLIGQLYSGYQLDNYESNTLTSLQGVLGDKGYQTTFINTEPNNTQFTSYLESFNFDTIVNENDLAEGPNGSLTDQAALELLYDTIENQVSKKTPFLTAIYTYGTHMTFDSADKMFEDGKNILFNRFYNFDYYFSQFLEKFTSNPAFDNTILVFTADHATFADKDFKAAYPSYNRENQDVDRVPFIVYHKGIGAEQKDVEGRNSLDLVPTLLDYMDISEPNYFLGESLFYYKENNNSFDTVFFDNAYLLSTDYGNIQPLSETNEETVKALLQKYFAAKQQKPNIP